MRQIFLVCLVSALFLAACGGGETNLFPDPAMKACIQSNLKREEPFIGRKLDITNKADLALLTSVGCSNAGIASLEGMEYIINAKDVAFYQNNITSLEPMRGLTKVEVLQINDNKITDIASLATMPLLSTANLTNNYIPSLDPLTSLTKLVAVYASGNCIADFSAYEKIKENNPNVMLTGNSADRQRPASECMAKE